MKVRIVKRMSQECNLTIKECGELYEKITDEIFKLMGELKVGESVSIMKYFRVLKITRKAKGFHNISTGKTSMRPERNVFIAKIKKIS